MMWMRIYLFATWNAIGIELEQNFQRVSTAQNEINFDIQRGSRDWQYWACSYTVKIIGAKFWSHIRLHCSVAHIYVCERMSCGDIELCLKSLRLWLRKCYANNMVSTYTVCGAIWAGDRWNCRQRRYKVFFSRRLTTIELWTLMGGQLHVSAQ